MQTANSNWERQIQIATLKHIAIRTGPKKQFGFDDVMQSLKVRLFSNAFSFRQHTVHFNGYVNK